jgi:GTP pyrophosphokinase
MVYIDSQFSNADQTTSEQVDNWVKSLGFAPQTEESGLIRKAFLFANSAHDQQKRASGEPYITHAMAVAEILVQLHLDPHAIAAAILHDVVEDTQYSLDELEQEFGEQVAHLVDGVTKLAFIEHQDLSERGTKEHLHAESLRKLLLAMAEDVRVVLIKLADRLHNMRTLKYLSEPKQKRVAKETLDIYAPLANRLGIWQVKWELEDLAFRFTQPENYKKVASFLDERRVDREKYIEQAIRIIKAEMHKAGISAQVTGRPKHIYSIWKKMQRKGVSFDALYDVRAVRVLVDKVQDCYAALGAIHTLWRHIPREFDDYIATPKENMYQSIHTAVVGPEGKTLEIQIRTHDMHQHAELGVAAHWSYKEGSKSAESSYDQKIAWLRQLLDWKEESDSAGDFIDRFKSEVFQDRVYVITPQGDIIDLAQGATPLDFAYHIHTDVGHRCRGARVNGRIVSLTYELKSGEQVEILTTKSGQPSRDWLNTHLGYLQTSRARAKVRQWFKQQDYETNVSLGRDHLEKDLRRLGLSGTNHKMLSDELGFSSTDDFYAAVGRGDVTQTQITSRVQALTPKTPAPASLQPRKARKQQSGDIQIEGVGNLLTKLARCCTPAPGDPIIGFITQGKGVTIHRRDCRNVLKMDDSKRQRLINVEWNSDAHELYPVDICVETIDRQGLLRDILNVLSNEKINVNTVNTQSNKRNNTAHMELTIEVAGIEQLSRILNRLGQLNNVIEVHRLNKN